MLTHIHNRFSQVEEEMGEWALNFFLDPSSYSSANEMNIWSSLLLQPAAIAAGLVYLINQLVHFFNETNLKTGRQLMTKKLQSRDQVSHGLHSNVFCNRSPLGIVSLNRANTNVNTVPIHSRYKCILKFL